MILNNNSTQQINTLLIQLQNRITNSTNEFIKLNDKLNNKIDNKIDNLDSKISDLEKNNDYDVSEMNAKIKANTEAISGKADKNHTHIKSEITDFDHTHDDRYYTESEVDTKLSGKADKIHTHTKSQITDFPTSLKNPNALTINGKTYDGSSAVDAGVQTVANGGTGVTTQADINKAFIGNLDTGESDVTDGTEFVSSWASDNGFAETTDGALNTPYKRKFILVWNYIKDKISSVLGLTGKKLTLQGGTVSSNSYTDTNPKLEFKNADGSQSISLTFTDYDAVQEPASLTLNGNQGNEYFIAPNIKATRNITLDSLEGASTSTYGLEPLTIGFPSGAVDGQSLGFDRNSIQAKRNGGANSLYLNYHGGMVSVNEPNNSNGGLKVKQKMVIPIGAPSSLEDGCIWIER